MKKKVDIVEVAAYVEINSIALAILLIIFVSIHKRTKDYLIGQKLFLSLLFSNAVLLILDTYMWIVNGIRGSGIREADLFITVVYFVINPLPCFLWGLYANYLVCKDEANLKKLSVLFLAPFLANAVLSVLSVPYGLAFFYDAENFYHRGRLFWLFAFFCYVYLFYTLFFIILNQRRIRDKFFIPILVFVLPPIIGGLIQDCFYGISLVWACMAISVLIIFLNIQNSQIYVDYLTGLYNRRHLDYYLRERMKTKGRKGMLAAVMIDLNDFKEINDNWGHSAGDEALMLTGNILKMSVKNNGMVCRYGGDEFVIILEIKDRLHLDTIINLIKKNKKKFNDRNAVPYRIEFSMGYDTYDFSSRKTMQQFLKHVDSLMYQNKKQTKQKDPVPVP